MIEPSVIQGLVENPSESLTVEIKRWIDPTQPAGIEKIVKGTFALRNRNGGFFIVGFDDETLAPDLANAPPDPRVLFHVDVIQGIISKYASDSFEIEIAWGEREGRFYPVIAVPTGVKVPVAAKRDLAIPARTGIRKGAVYFRSLEANGTPSTTEAHPGDWADIVEICFDNREADVGRFIRRHLGTFDLSSILKMIGAPEPPKPTLRDRAVKILEDGEARFENAVKSRVLTPEEGEMLSYGAWSIGLVIDPPHPDALPNREFLERIGSINPKFTGWPIWLDARLMSDTRGRPSVVAGAYQYLILSISSGVSNHIDFARLDPKGEFFLHRLLQDDGIPSQMKPLSALDPVLMIFRVAEAMGVGLAFAKGLGWVPDQTTLGFVFRWSKLTGRRLTAWANPMYETGIGGTAHDDKIETYVEFSLDTPLSALAQYVDAATKPLFVAFDGATMPARATEAMVKRLLERKL
jgi:hypothetical protein